MALPEKKKKPISISLRQYVDNPYKGSSYLASRKMIKEGLNRAFIGLLQNYRKQFYAVPYLDPNGDVMFHVKVPSEDYGKNKILYDVLILFKYDKEKRYAVRDIKMFSNSPSFLYTYAYVYYHDDIMIDSFADKMPIIALVNPPEVRNPVESLGYEKSTYFAARYLLDGMILNDVYINRFKKPLTPFQLMTLQMNIADPQDIVEIYNHAKTLQVKKPRVARDKDVMARRAEMKKRYQERNVISKPAGVGLLKRKPQAKITARSAKRSLMNEKKK